LSDGRPHPADELRDSERLLRALRGAVPVEAPEKVAARRNVLVAAISREIEAVPTRIAKQERRRRWLRTASVAAATLALTLSGTALWQATWGEAHGVAQLEVGNAPSDGQALVTLITTHGTRQDTLSTGQELTVGRNEQVDALLPGATRIQFEPLALIEPRADHQSAEQATLQLNQLKELNQSLFVKAGSLSVDVPESRPSRRLVTVVTPHARVEVKGTQFQVQVSDGTNAHTRVSVSRGSVLVSWLGGHTLLSRGQTWDSKSLSHAPKASIAEPSGGVHETTAPHKNAASHENAASHGGTAAPVRETRREAVAASSVRDARPVDARRIASRKTTDDVDTLT